MAEQATSKQDPLHENCHSPRPTHEQALRSAIQARLGDSRYGLWFGAGVRLHLDNNGDTLEVRASDPFFCDWIRDHYSVSLIDAAESVVGRRPRLKFHLDEPASRDPAPAQSTQTAAERSLAPTSSDALPAPPVRPRLARDTPRPPDHIHPPASPRRGRPPRRLEDFVIGPGNRLAHAAACEMVRTTGASFNPLVIHAAVGLGKSHLLEGVAHALRQASPSANVVLVTAESFTNAFLDAMRQGTLNSFRSRFRTAAGLIVDDVHFLAAKRATQDEFLHTFNAIHDKGAPIVLALDQHPRQVARLTEELVTRFLAGMVARIDAPDPGTRLAILRAWVESRQLAVPDEVLRYIAENLRSNVRELEGALNLVVAHAALSGKQIDLALARSALRDSIRQTTRGVGLKDVEDVICRFFQLSPDELKSEGRGRSLAYPRMLAMYLARKHLNVPYGEIGRYFGDRNHSTVIAAEKKVAAWLRAEQKSSLLPGFESAAELIAELERALSDIAGG